MAAPQDPRTHFAFPLRWNPDGGYATVAEGSLDEVLQNVEVLFSTQQGERIEVLDYGISDPTFRNEVDRQHLAHQVEAYVPQALVALSDSLDPVDEAIRQVLVKVKQRGS